MGYSGMLITVLSDCLTSFSVCILPIPHESPLCHCMEEESVHAIAM